MKVQFSLLFLFFATVFGACPRLSTVTNLDLEKHVGTWQIHGMVKTAQAPVTGIKCLQKTLSGTNFGTAPVKIDSVLMGTDPNGDMMHEDMGVTINSLVTPGIWDVLRNGVVSRGYVLFTDYVEYSLFAICNNNDDGNMEAYIMSRYHDPIGANILENFKRTLVEEHGIDLTNYVDIFHSHMDCGH